MTESFAGYNLVALIGSGQTGAVYEAQHQKSGRRCAIKRLHVDRTRDAAFVRRFENECKILTRIRCSWIVAPICFGVERGIPWLEMELIEGGSMQARLDQASYDRDVLLAGLDDVARGLDEAHARRIIHRDVKPGNILIRRNGRMVLCDFGLAKLVGESMNLTTTGAVLGTTLYMAPEQARGMKLTPACDIYSLGIVVYRVIAGKPPFQAENAHALMWKHVEEPMPDPGTSVPDAVRIALAKALAKNPRDRWTKALDFVIAVRDGFAIARQQLRVSRLTATEITTESPALKKNAVQTKEARQKSIEGTERTRLFYSDEVMVVTADAEQWARTAARLKLLGLGAKWSMSVHAYIAAFLPRANYSAVILDSSGIGEPATAAIEKIRSSETRLGLAEGHIVFMAARAVPLAAVNQCLNAGANSVVNSAATLAEWRETFARHGIIQARTGAQARDGLPATAGNRIAAAPVLPAISPESIARIGGSDRGFHAALVQAANACLFHAERLQKALGDGDGNGVTAWGSRIISTGAEFGFVAVADAAANLLANTSNPVAVERLTQEIDRLIKKAAGLSIG